MHPRQAAKLQALKELGDGATDYRTFNRAASFGQIEPEEFVRVKGYQRGLRWASSYSNDPEAMAKDHMLSRSWAYHNHEKVVEVLTPELAISLMAHVAKYGLKMEPRVNHTLCLMAIMTGHWKNCEVMKVRDNSRKGAACSITLPELANLIQSG